MTELTLAPLGTTVFELLQDGKQVAVVRDLNDAMLRIAMLVSGSEEAVNKMRRGDEFPELSAPGLSGSFYNRIRYEAAKGTSDFFISEHNIVETFKGPSVVKKLSVTHQFDPSFIVQAALYDVASGIADVDEAAGDVEEAIERRLRKHLSQNPNSEDMVSHIRQTQQQMGGPILLPQEITDPDQVLRELPATAGARFRELAAVAFPARSMKV